GICSGTITLKDLDNNLNRIITGTILEEALQLIRYDNIKGSIIEYEQILPDKKVLYKIPPRSNYIVEPKVISNKFAGLIISWIDRRDHMESQYTGFNSPFRFRHIFRMHDKSKFSTQLYRFHHYSNKLPTIKCYEGPSLMIMNLKILENSLVLTIPFNGNKVQSSICGSTSENFIFTYDDKYGSNYRLCRVKNFDHAVCLVSDFGGLLNFGEDLMFKFDKENLRCHIKCKFYEPTTLAEGIYEVEEWNVYKVRRKDDQPMRVMTKNPEKDLYLKSNMPFQFTPIFRMNNHTAFYPKQFYNQSTNRLLPTMKCHHEPSLMLMKLKNGKIVGAYNPLDWTYGVNDGVNYRLSRVVNFDEAIASKKISTNRKELNDLILRFEQNGHYEQPAILPSGNYEIGQWEIFRVSKKDPEALDME
ncbi:35073_t:CDS:2, partial [Racocetra persica]